MYVNRIWCLILSAIVSTCYEYAYHINEQNLLKWHHLKDVVQTLTIKPLGLLGRSVEKQYIFRNLKVAQSSMFNSVRHKVRISWNLTTNHFGLLAEEWKTNSRPQPNSKQYSEGIRLNFMLNPGLCSLQILCHSFYMNIVIQIIQICYLPRSS